jgi:hypothetical protein
MEVLNWFSMSEKGVTPSVDAAVHQQAKQMEMRTE